MSLEELRRQYTIGGIDEAGMPNDPIALFGDWMQAALDNAPQEWVEPYAMTLATSDPSGSVSARVVLLRGFSDDGFVFYTNYESAKGKQLAANAQAALVFYWGYLERQVRVQGVVSKVSREQSLQYFHKRPRGSQIGATISRQSQAIANRQVLEEKVESFVAKVGDEEIALPDDWGGYQLKASEIEFWQGRANRLHDRLVYSSGSDDSWALRRLSP